MRHCVAIYYRFALLSIGLLLAACETIGTKVDYKPLGVPLKFSINSWGEIEAELYFSDVFKQ